MGLRKIGVLWLGETYSGIRNNGDITSLLYRGTQYQATEKGTQINSGLGLVFAISSSIVFARCRIVCLLGC